MVTKAVADIQHLAAVFQRHIADEVLTGDASRRACATDASPYFRMPAAVLRPRDRADVIAIAELASELGVPLIPRAAGTSLAGQCVGAGFVVDMGARQNLVLDFDPGMGHVMVQPGIVRDVLNDHLAPHGLTFAPDPSTTAACQIGGMVGNNAWGLHAVRDGSTRDHVVAMEAVLADGTPVHLHELHAAALNDKQALPGREGDIYRAVTGHIGQYAAEIEEGFPSVRGIPNNAGYALDVLLRGQPWIGDGPRFNLAPLMCGSEGTLALVTAVKLKLIKRPRAQTLLCLQFDAIESALASVPSLRAMRPAALELLERAILRIAAAHPEQCANRFWYHDEPAAVLLVEVSGDSAGEVNAAVERVRREFPTLPCVVLEGVDIERAWSLRRAALGMLMEPGRDSLAVTGIEDVAVASEDLPAFYADVKGLLADLRMPFYIYGPVGMGALHIRPQLRLDSAAAATTYEQLLDSVAAITVRYRGSFSCKHGDGRMRGKYLSWVLGDDVVTAVRAVKQAFDPAGILNPGKILDCPPVTADLAQTIRR